MQNGRRRACLPFNRSGIPAQVPASRRIRFVAPDELQEPGGLLKPLHHLAVEVDPEFFQPEESCADDWLVAPCLTLAFGARQWTWAAMVSVRSDPFPLSRLVDRTPYPRFFANSLHPHPSPELVACLIKNQGPVLLLSPDLGVSLLTISTGQDFAIDPQQSSNESVACFCLSRDGHKSVSILRAIM